MATKRGKAKPRSTAETSGLSRGELVHHELLQAIRDGRYPSGTRVREAEVADWLGVSRTPVREALRRLQSEGLVVFTPWRGVVVAELDQQQVIELYAMRRVLEGTAARLAAQHAADSEIDGLIDLVEREKAAKGDIDRLVDINGRFHQAIYSAAHNRYLLKALNSLSDSLALLRSTTYGVPGRPAAAITEHQAIVAAIQSRDANAAESAASDHLGGAERARLKVLFEMQENGETP